MWQEEVKKNSALLSVARDSRSTTDDYHALSRKLGEHLDGGQEEAEGG